MKLPLASFSQRLLVEKFFRVLLGGLMASSVPRGRPLEARIITSGWGTVNQDCVHLHLEKSDGPSPCIPFSHLRRLVKHVVQ